MQCEGILAEAIPALNAAVAALDTIKKPDIQLVAVRVAACLAHVASPCNLAFRPVQ